MNLLKKIKFKILTNNKLQYSIIIVIKTKIIIFKNNILLKIMINICLNKIKNILNK
jgi:hypothetical protein